MLDQPPRAGAIRRGQAESGQSLLPTGTSPPGIMGVQFSPSGLGVTLSIPSTWANGGPASGFQYSARSSKPPFDFVLAGSHARLASNVDALARGRTASLHGFDTTIQSVKTGTADGLPAVEFRYLIRMGQLTAQDLEYDILSGARVVLIVIGTSPESPDPGLVNWMASTIRVGNP